MAQIGNSHPSQILHVESEQMLSAWFQKLPAQLNTVSEIVRVSSNASDGQWLAQCVSCLKARETLFSNFLAIALSVLIRSGHYGLNT